MTYEERKARGVRLFNGDSAEILKTFPDGFASSVVTDPPYGMDFQSNRSKAGPRHEKIVNDSEINGDWLKESFRIVKDGGCILSFCNWDTSHIWRSLIEDVGFTVKSQVIWNRLHHGMGDLKGAFAPMHDVVWYGVKGRRVFSNGRPKSVIECKRPSPSEDNGHPTCKPVSLMKQLINSVEDGTGGVVVDPFMGSGSTGVACKELGLPFVGIELVFEYYETAVKRMGLGDDRG